MWIFIIVGKNILNQKHCLEQGSVVISPFIIMISNYIKTGKNLYIYIFIISLRDLPKANY